MQTLFTIQLIAAKDAQERKEVRGSRGLGGKSSGVVREEGGGEEEGAGEVENSSVEDV